MAARPPGTAPNQTCDLTGGRASYFTFVVGEYCTLASLKACITASAPTSTHKYPAPVRWCNNSALAQSGGTNKCQALKNSTYTFPRYPGAQGASATLTVGSGTSTSVSSVKVNGLQILSATTAATSNSTDLATYIKNNINACTTASAGNCTTAGYRATSSSGVVTIIAPGSITYTPVVIKSGGKTVTPTAFTGGLPGTMTYTEIDPAITSYPYPGTSAKHPSRTDCAGATCSYNEEMTNYANWFTYYHFRMNMMKSGVSRAFKSIDNKFRVGFNTINYTGASDADNRFLHIDKFELTHKKTWYDKLFMTTGTSSTPLQNSLGKVGRLFANKVSNQADPMQYSCQQNFSILSTDGFWNSSSNSYSLTGGLVGNLDSGSTPLPMHEGGTVSNSLADIAKYYYDTDLRTLHWVTVPVHWDDGTRPRRTV